MSAKWDSKRKSGKKKGNIGISAVNGTIYTMNHEPIPEVVYEEFERFLDGIHEKTGVRLLTAITKG